MAPRHVSAIRTGDRLLHTRQGRFTPASWRAFVAAVRNRESDLDESGRLP